MLNEACGGATSSQSATNKWVGWIREGRELWKMMKIKGIKNDAFTHTYTHSYEVQLNVWMKNFVNNENTISQAHEDRQRNLSAA